MTNTKISPGAILLLSAVIFFGGFLDISALLTAVVVHELGHIAAVKISEGSICSFSLSVFGAEIKYYGIMSRASELISILAGPISGAMLAYIASYVGNSHHDIFMLKIAGYSAALTAFNIMPVKILDGGRALDVIVSGIFGATVSHIVLEITGYACAFAIMCFGLYYHYYEFAPILFGGGFVLLMSQSGIVESG